MKTVMISELLIWKKSIIMISALYVVIGVVVGLFIENPWTTTAMVACMFAISSAFSGPAADEKNNWMVGRLCLPVSRKDVVTGRYAATGLFTLLGIAISLVATLLVIAVAQLFPGNEIVSMVAEGGVMPLTVLAAVAAAGIVAVACGVFFPLSFAFGNKRALKLVPVAVVLLILAVGAVASSGAVDALGISPALESMFADSVFPLIAVIVVAYVVIMVISCVISIRVYQRREL